MTKKHRRQKNNFNCKRFSATILLFLILTLSQITLISAWEWDNVKDYDYSTRTATITNALGFGATIADIQLITPNHYYVEVGYNKVAQFEIDNRGTYESPIDKVETFTKTNMESIERDIDYKYWKVTGTTTVNDYENQCTYLTNGSINVCEDVIVGTHEEETGEWIDFDNTAELPEGKITIGLFTEVLEGDYIEWIPELFGVEIPEWAAWEAVVIDTNPGNNDGGAHGSHAGMNGQLFEANFDLRVVAIGALYSSGNPQVCYIVNHSNIARVEAFGPIQSNGTCILNQTVRIKSGHMYWATVDKNGTNFGGGNQNTSAVNVSGTNIKWVAEEMDNNATINTRITSYIQNISTQKEISIVSATTLIYPPNNTITINDTIIFDSNASINGDSLVNATLFVWNPDGTEFGRNTTTAITGTATSANLSMSALAINDSYHWNVWWCGNDSEGSYNCSFSPDNRSFDIRPILENSQTFNTSTIETAVEGFIANVTYNSSTYTVITGRLFYNDTWYTGTKTGTGGEAIFTTTATAPSLTTKTDINFTWEISTTNDSGTVIYNLTNYSQEVNPMLMGLCDNNAFNYSFLNLTIQDENTLTTMNATLEAVFSYSSTGSDKSSTYNYTAATEVNSTYSFCFTPPDKTYEIDATLELGAANYVTKFYEFEDLELTNVTTNQTLYMLESGNSTSFIILVRDSGYNVIENAIVHVQRYDVGTASWLTTEQVQTNFEGKAIGHLLSEDADYRFLVYLSGVLQYTSSSTKITCEETPCTVTLTIPASVSSSYEPFEDPDDFTSSLTWDSSALTFTYTYSDSSDDFVDARLHVVRVMYGNATRFAHSCNETKTTANGVMTCDISASVHNNGTYVATGYLSRTGDLQQIVERLTRYKLSTIANTVGLDGLLWGFFLFLGIVMAGLYRPSMAILTGIFGIIFLWMLQLIDFTITAVVAVIAIAIIMLWEMGKQ